MIDMQKARVAFKDYVGHYDVHVDEIRLKIVHTYEVIKLTDYICDKRHIKGDDKALGELIALLHDIGRFEQFVRYGSYIDYQTIDHAQLGSDILFKDGLIRSFVEDDQYDDIIRHAIEQHNKFQVSSSYDEQTMFYIWLIRDTDKLDNFRVKETEKVETLLHAPLDTILQEDITDKVYDDFMHHHLIYGPDRQSHIDMWVSLVAFIYDFNFPESKQYVLENDYINRSFNRLTPAREDVRQKYEALRQEALRYIHE